MFKKSFQELNSYVERASIDNDLVVQEIRKKYNQDFSEKGNKSQGRLRKHLCECFVRYANLYDLQECAGSLENLQLLLETMSRTWGGETWLRDANDAVDANRIILNAEARRALSSVLPSKNVKWRLNPFY
jgi:hypothetical protein